MGLKALNRLTFLHGTRSEIGQLINRLRTIVDQQILRVFVRISDVTAMDPVVV